MVQEAIAQIRERYQGTPLVAVIGGASQHSAREAYELGRATREAMAHIGGVSFTVGFPSWCVDFYRGVKDYARDTLNRAFGEALRGKLTQGGDGRDLFFLLLPQDFQEALRERVSIYRGLHHLNGNTSLSYEIAGATMKETMAAVIPEVADLVVLHNGNERLAAYASRLVAAGRRVFPIITSGGSSELLAKYARDQANPREVAEVARSGVILDPEQKELVQPVYDAARLRYALANALGLTPADELLDSRLLPPALPGSLEQVPSKLVKVDEEQAATTLPKEDVSLRDLIDRSIDETLSDSESAALAEAVMQSIMRHGKRDLK